MPEHQQIHQSKRQKTYSQRRKSSASQVYASNPSSVIQRARINPKSLTSADVLQLQRTIGNQEVGRLLSGIGKSPFIAQQAPVQRQKNPEEEKPLQSKIIETVQRQEIPEEEEPLQGKFEREPDKETCPLCQIPPIVQKQELEEEEKPLQGKMIETVQRQEIPEEEEPLQKKENNTGMPDDLKAGVENLSGIDMSNVRVHYNSSEPAEVGALAYTQGINIHVAPGQERYLPHEAWHVVQQKQGRVHPTMQMRGGIPANDDLELEHEADYMGRKATITGHSMSLNVYSDIKVVHPLDTKNAHELPSTLQRVTKQVSSRAANRLNKARDAINYTKVTIPAAGNQIPALRSESLNPYFRMKVMRNEKPPSIQGHVFPDPPYWQFTSNSAKKLASDNPADYTKAKARLAHGGNCGEHASVAYSYLRVFATGEKIAKCSVDGLDHAFVLIGDLTPVLGDFDEEIAVADPWPTQAKATLWEDHFAYKPWHISINQHLSMVADGQDVEPLISAGLQLTPEGQQVITEKLSPADTESFIEDHKGHLWNHRLASKAGKEYDHRDPTGASIGI